MANGDHKPGYALADLLRERHVRNRTKFERAVREAFDDWERPTDPELLASRVQDPPPIVVGQEESEEKPRIGYRFGLTLSRDARLVLPHLVWLGVLFFVSILGSVVAYNMFQ